MTHSLTTQPDQEQISEKRTSVSDVMTQLVSLSSQSRTVRSFYRAVMHVIGDHFKSPFVSICVSCGTGTLEESVEDNPPTSSGLWSRVTKASLLDAQSKEITLARLYTVEGTGTPIAVLSVPIRQDSEENCGAIALVTACEGKTAAQKFLMELESFTALASALALVLYSSKLPNSDGETGIHRALLKASEYSSLAELAFILTNGLKTKFDCDRVVMGFVEKKRVKIISISEMDAIYPRSPGTGLMQQSMEECLDSGEMIYVSADEERTAATTAVDFRLHSQWAQAIGHASVASIPLCINNSCVAVVSLTRPKGSKFGQDELEKISTALQPYAPALLLVARSSRSLAVHAAESVRSGASWFYAPGRWRRKMMAGAALITCLWFFFAETPYRVSVPCSITADTMRNFAAPYQGAIEESYVNVGDHVEKGQLLFKMDTTLLRLRHGELESEAAIALLQTSQAVKGQDLDAAAQATSRLRVIQARLEVVRQQIHQSQIRAPCRGTIMAGEISKRVGEVVPMGEPLIQFAPHDAWCIDLHIPENDIFNVQSGLNGKFASLARPGDSVSFTIDVISPASKLVDHQNVFVATASVSRNPSWMRIGMQGIATVDAGRRRVCWVALHRVIDAIRLHCGF